MSLISAEQFLARAVLDNQRRPGHRWPAGSPINRLFVGTCDTREQVSKLISQITGCGCRVHFEDNPKQPNYAPRIYVEPVESQPTQKLLAATAILVSNYHPDQMDVVSTGVWFWWD